MSSFTLCRSAASVDTEKSVAARARELFEERYAIVLRNADRLFGVLLVLQWVAAVLAAVWLSPYAWAGRERAVHLHVYAAFILGGALTSFPVALIIMRPGRPSTRYVVAVAQMLWSALLIHLTGGRIETHFHVFGSLAFLAFYRDMRLLVVASVIVTVDHFARGVLWPESVYGVVNPEWWRFLEHSGWVLFIDVFIAMNARQSLRDMHGLVERQARIEAFQREQLARVERLAEIGELAASIGHELRNPLAAIRNAHAYIGRRLGDAMHTADAKVPEFMSLIDRELTACSRIIANLLEFARARELQLARCPLRPLVDEAVSLVATPASVRVVNTIPDHAPALEVDKDQLRQVLVNLVQNAVEAVPRDGRGEVIILCNETATGLSLQVIDNGAGIAPGDLERVFEPLYSTKMKGTGLGLAIVARIVERHGGKLSVTSVVGGGSTFAIELPRAGSAVAVGAA